MSLLFVAFSLGVILSQRSEILTVIHRMIREAFSLRAVAGGSSGMGMKLALEWGLKRSAFSNEAGLGSNTVIHASADCDEAGIQGMWGIFEVMFDTLFMCTVTAITVLSSGVDFSSGQLDGIALCSAAFESVIGGAGKIILGISICLFAYATLIAWSFYGKSAAAYLFGDGAGKYYNILYTVAVFIGCIMKLDTVWSLSDIFNGLLAIPNIYAVLKLSKEAVSLLNDAKSLR